MARRKPDPADEVVNSLLYQGAELKRYLVEFAEQPRFRRYLSALVNEAAGPRGVLTEGIAYRAMDDFIFTYELPGGRTVLEQFIAAGPRLPAADREVLLRWRDFVDGIFEIKDKRGAAMILLNLIDDLEYRVYSNTGPEIFRQLPVGGFVIGRVLPLGADWMVSGVLSGYARSDRTEIAGIAVTVAKGRPEAVFRNPELLARGWELARESRTHFVEYFGSDELVLSPGVAQELLDAQRRAEDEVRMSRSRRPEPQGEVAPFKLPEDLFALGTVGVIFDEVDGLSFYPDYGMLHELFATPALASRKDYARVLQDYLHEESIGPLPLRRLAAAYPETVDAVYRKVLRQPHFTWAEHGEALLRKRKSWYFDRDPYPCVVPAGRRLADLYQGRRRLDPAQEYFLKAGHAIAQEDFRPVAI
jgi:hypothetical protein